MRRNVALISAIFILSLPLAHTAKAQYYFYNDSYYDNPVLFEVGASVGAMNCLTDLGGKKGIGKKFIKDLNYGKTHTSVGVFVSASLKNALSARLEATFGKVSADDAELATVPSSDIARTRFNRNLNFESKITEYSFMLEAHPFYLFIDWENRDDAPPRYSPYILGGIGYYSFNPQARISNKLIDLQPLSTEGQGLAEYPDKQVYKLKQINFPLGAGVKYELSTLLNLRAEFVYRILTTDYLDDCSGNYIDPAAYTANGFSGVRLTNALLLNNREINGQNTQPGGKRGSPTNNDGFFSFNLKLSMTIGRERIR